MALLPSHLFVKIKDVLNMWWIEGSGARSSQGNFVFSVSIVWYSTWWKKQWQTMLTENSGNVIAAFCSKPSFYCLDNLSQRYSDYSFLKSKFLCKASFLIKFTATETKISALPTIIPVSNWLLASSPSELFLELRIWWKF